jgi:hypothetical protein
VRRTAILLTTLGVLLASSIGLRSQAAAAPLAINWTEYHDFAAVTKILNGLTAQYKNLSKVYSVGKSFQGRDLWCIEVTNYATGAPETKPGIYLDGNTHAGEISGTEVCLYLANYLLTNYGKDPGVTKLVDTRVFYVIPRVNPDGSEEYLRKPGAPVDPNTKKFDDDGDGRLDEDLAEDLNGDGIISVMRIRDDNGQYVTSPKDPRLLVPRKLGEKGEWRILGTEGTDNDDDGKLNEDPPGKATTVTNRNYPSYWAPEWVQSGGGTYPLSQSEAKAQVDFVLAHPNIASTQAFHTHSGVILFGYSALPDDQVPPEDLANMKAIAAMGAEITGYNAISVYDGFTTDKLHPRHGDFTDWVYDNAGAFTLCTELWKAPGEKGKTAFDGLDEEEAIKWSDTEIGGKGFVNWAKYKHPQYGDIEIGGWDGNFIIQNPPPKFAEDHWRKNTLFELKRAEITASLQIVEAKAEPVGDNLFRIVATVENPGFLPTYLTQMALKSGQAKPVAAKIAVQNGEVLCCDDRIELGHITGVKPGTPRTGGNPSGQPKPDNRKTVKWLVRAKPGATATVTFSSPKVGTASKQLALTPTAPASKK